MVLPSEAMLLVDSSNTVSVLLKDSLLSANKCEQVQEKRL
jgi:hypothetical protein